MMELWYSLLSLLPFTWAQADGLLFMKNAFLAVLVITPLFGLLSTMVVTNKMSFFSDALGHSAFTGMAVGTLAGALAPTPCAVVFAVVFALLFTLVQRKATCPAIQSSACFPPPPWLWAFSSPPWADKVSPSSTAF